MVIVDTSVWVNSFRQADTALAHWMNNDLVLQHPFVTAEIGMGSFGSTKLRERTLDFLDGLTQVPVAEAKRFHAFVSEHALFGTGLGFVDAHVLLACSDHPTAQLATRDKRLAMQAERLGIEVLP